jgi:hypothetical protein
MLVRVARLVDRHVVDAHFQVLPLARIEAAHVHAADVTHAGVVREHDAGGQREIALGV